MTSRKEVAAALRAAKLEALSAQNFELYQKLHGATHHEHR